MTSVKFFLPALCLATSLTALGAGTARFNVTSGAWEDSANWTTSNGATLPPSSADTAQFGFAGGSSVTLAANHIVGGGGIFVLTDTTMTGLTALRTLNVSAGNSLVNATLTLDQVKITKPAGNLTMLGNSVLQNGGVIEIGIGGFGALNTTSARQITSGGGSGNAYVSAGTTAVSGGTFDYTLGSGVNFTSTGILSMNSGTLSLSGASSVNALSGALNYTSANSATFKNSGTLTVGALTVAGDTTNGGTDAFENAGTLNVGAGGVAAFNKPTGGSYTIQNTSGGTFNLNSGNSVTFNEPFHQTGSSTLSFNSPTFILGATMTIDGGSVIGNWTGGSGTGGAVFNSGTLSPGTAGVGNLGTIAFPAALTLNSPAGLTIDINGDASYDRASAGAVTLSSASLAVRRNGTVTAGTIFDVLSGTSNLSGTFSGLAEGALVNASDPVMKFTINYGTVHANAVTLTAVVPEPGTYGAAAGLGLMAFAGWRLRRRQA